jgi:hypothetical protein
MERKKLEKMDKSTNIVKIVLAILFFICLAKMPYGYYEFVRFIAMIGFAFLAYKSNELGRHTEMFIYIALAILFQPFLKIALGRELWNIVDVGVGIGLITSLFIKTKDEKL